MNNKTLYYNIFAILCVTLWQKNLSFPTSGVLSNPVGVETMEKFLLQTVASLLVTVSFMEMSGNTVSADSFPISESPSQVNNQSDGVSSQNIIPKEFTNFLITISLASLAVGFARYALSKSKE